VLRDVLLYHWTNNITLKFFLRARLEQFLLEKMQGPSPAIFRELQCGSAPRHFRQAIFKIGDFPVPLNLEPASRYLLLR